MAGGQGSALGSGPIPDAADSRKGQVFFHFPPFLLHLASAGWIFIHTKYTFSIDKCVLNVYNNSQKGDIMKQRDLIKKLEAAGFVFERHGGNHDVYRRENEIENIPRHKEIDERLARAILRKWGI